MNIKAPLRFAKQTTLIFCLLLSLIANSQDFNNPVFKYCYDGDTCTFDLVGLPPIFGKNISVRLLGVDTPEMRGKCKAEIILAKKAKTFVNDILKRANAIKLLNVQRGKYFRLVSRILVDGKYLDEELIKNGLGRFYDGGKRKSWCK